MAAAAWSRMGKTLKDVQVTSAPGEVRVLLILVSLTITMQKEGAPNSIKAAVWIAEMIASWLAKTKDANGAVAEVSYSSGDTWQCQCSCQCFPPRRWNETKDIAYEHHPRADPPHN